MSDDSRSAEAAAGMLGGDEETFRALLQSIVDVARAIFGAEASSIFLYDEETDELVFEAVSGQGGDSLVGTRFPSSTGIAGFALVTRQQLVVDDLASDARFSRERAESTGYVPNSIVASPLLHDERTLGVLSVLDRDPERPFGVAELELLSRFSTQAAIALDLLLRARRARSALAGEGSAALVGRVASLLDEDDGSEGVQLLEAIERLLAARRA
jgi:GAF domain-containing protein